MESDWACGGCGGEGEVHACMGHGSRGMGGSGEGVQGSKVTGDVVVPCAPCMGMGSVRAVGMHAWMEPRESGAGTAEGVACHGAHLGTSQNCLCC